MDYIIKAVYNSQTGRILSGPSGYCICYGCFHYKPKRCFPKTKKGNTNKRCFDCWKAKNLPHSKTVTLEEYEKIKVRTIKRRKERVKKGCFECFEKLSKKIKKGKFKSQEQIKELVCTPCLKAKKERKEI